MAAINANVIKFLTAAKRGMFSSSAWRPSLFTMGLGYFGTKKAMQGAGNMLKSGGNNIPFYRGLYTDRGDNIMASGKRGIDSRSNGTGGLVQGLHSNRRKY